MRSRSLKVQKCNIRKFLGASVEELRATISLAGLRPSRSFWAASPPLECRRSLKWGDSCSDVCRGWIPGHAP